MSLTENRLGNIYKIILAIFLGFYFFYTALNPSEWHFIDNIDLIFHEAGHIIFFFLGKFVSILGGSFMQILIPFVFCFYFFANGQRYSASLLLFWFGQNLINISVYIGDAIKMQLPLLGGDGVIHDWNYLLSTLNILDLTSSISNLFYFGGLLSYSTALVLAIVFTLWGTDHLRCFLGEVRTFFEQNPQ